MAQESKVAYQRHPTRLLIVDILCSLLSADVIGLKSAKLSQQHMGGKTYTWRVMACWVYLIKTGMVCANRFIKNVLAGA